MNNLKIFNNKEFGEIRTLIIDGKIISVRRRVNEQREEVRRDVKESLP